MNSIADLNKVVSTSSAGNDFLRMAKAIAAGRGRWPEIQKLARNIPSTRVREVLEKSAIIPNAIGDASGSSELAPYRELAAGFFGSLAEFSAFSRIYNAGDFTRVPLRTLIAVLTTAPVAESVSALSAKPISSAEFSRATLDAERVASFIVITNELARSVSQASLLMLGQELRRAAAIAIDEKFLALLAATPGMTTAGSSGVTAANILADLTARVTALTIGADSRLWLIVSPKLFKTLSLVQGTGGYLMQNNKIGMVNVAPSDAATTTATLIDAKGIAAELDGVVLDSARDASLQLDTNPTSGDYELLSLWAQDLTGLRCEVAFGAIAMRSTSVTTVTGYA